MKKQGKQNKENTNSKDFCTASAHYFRTVWKVDAGSFIEFGTVGAHTVDWGDGCTEQVKDKDKALKHTYVKKGEYTVSISSGVTEFWLNQSSTRKLIEIKQWGAAQWKDMSCMFDGARNMVCTATDTPDTSKVEKMSFMFNKCKKFNSPIEHWDTKRVKYMNSMLSHALMFNRSLAKMDLKAIENVYCMLEDTPAFDQDLRDFKPKANTDGLFGRDKSLAQYNKEHAERFAVQEEKEDVYNVLNG